MVRELETQSSLAIFQDCSVGMEFRNGFTGESGGLEEISLAAHWPDGGCGLRAGWQDSLTPMVG